jgi:hypothetical protein
MEPSARRISRIIRELDRLQLVLNAASTEVRDALATGDLQAVFETVVCVSAIDAQTRALADEWADIVQDLRHGNRRVA